MISVLILTRNEQRNLPACLKTVNWCDDIVVFDSFSTDETLAIARSAGARVIQRKFDNEREHRAASLQVQFKHKWVYNPDADEVASADLVAEMHDVVRCEHANVAYRCRFKTMFMGKWIRYSSLYPTWVMRLFRPEKIAFERTTNLRYIVDGEEGRLNAHFLHYTFNNGFEAWFAKHNVYSTFEAQENLTILRDGNVNWSDLINRDQVRRRSALKELSFHVPCRMLLRFIYMYFWRRGCLDGRAGLDYCRLLAIYEYMIVMKVRELKRRQHGLDI